MPPAGATPDQVAEYIRLLGLVLLGSGAWIWFEGWLKRNGCPQCPHCRQEREVREQKEREDAEKFYGLDKESRATRERFFGRQVVDESPPEVVAQPDAEASSGSDGDRGSEDV